MFSMNKLSREQRIQVVSALVEGVSINATVRMTGVAKNTVLKLLRDIGAACLDYQDNAFQNLKLNRLECDEIWSFVYAKQKNVTPEMDAERWAGDVWTWTAIDAETKLVPSWIVGSRDAETARNFVNDLKSRLANRVQITTDGLKLYVNAIDSAFGGEIDYAILIKVYGATFDQAGKYSPAECIGTEKHIVSGAPDKEKISTSFVERQNLTMRMHMRRFTRLTNGFSKKIENHIAAISLHFMYYNFAKIHKTLRCSPAMAAGVTGKLWEIGDIVDLLTD